MAAPELSAYNYVVNGTVRQAIGKGHGVQHHDLKADNSPAANCRPTSQVGDNQTLDLFINEVTTNFSVAGSYSQSAKQREFHPHHFEQPVITFTGETANNLEYNRLAEFIRHTQKRAVFFDQHDLAKPTISILLRAGGKYTLRNHRGLRSPWLLEGFIPKAMRGAERFRFKHGYQFEFVVARSVYGVMIDPDLHNPTRLAKWTDALAYGKRISDPDDVNAAKKAKADKAKKDEAYEDSERRGAPRSRP